MLKKLLTVIVILVLASLMTSCVKRQDVSNNEQDSNSLFLSNTESQTSSINSDSQVSRENTTLCVGETQFMLSINDSEYLIDLFDSHNDDIVGGIYKLHYDYSFIIENERWEYCSDAGAFCNTSKKQSFLISESEKKEVNLIIQSVV